MNIKEEVITSRQNRTVIRTASLMEKKYRDVEQCFAACGIKLFMEAVKSRACIQCVLIAASKREQFMPTIAEQLADDLYAETEILYLSDECFNKVTDEKSPQGILTIIKYLDKIKNNIKIYKDSVSESEIGKAVFLYSVRDPSNLGAVMRSASAFGVSTVIMSADCADVYQPKTVRAAMGALFRLSVLIVQDSVACIYALRESGRRVYAAELTPQAVSVNETGVRRGDIFVIGNEGHGIDPAASAACDGSVYLPIAPDTESLNAAVAASIFLWEQRDK